ncbi:MAG: UDP-glucose--hexose-1-phosphate uridylyltransferase [Pyrinomonadaceae bacterium]
MNQIHLAPEKPMLELKEQPHRRYNPLTQEWVLVSPHRTQRPWQGQVEEAAKVQQPVYDPACYLCPGNTRANGDVNRAYTSTFVFDNDYAALLPDTSDFQSNEDGLLVAESERGICRVVCFSPRHDLTLARMSVGEIRQVVDVWAEQFVELGALPFIGSVQIFENRGAVMGASNPHPHCQIWANENLPNETVKELISLDAYRQIHKRSLLADYLVLELKAKERIVCQNEHFVTLVPFWAVWPFETLIISRKQVGGIDELDAAQRTDLADILKQTTTRYDNLFKTSFPYTMGFHQRPTDAQSHPECHFHAHFYPPLLRSATVRKFMVGYEMLGSPQRDITPETAAMTLRELPAKHYAE